MDDDRHSFDPDAPGRPAPGTVRLRLLVNGGRVARVRIENARVTGPFRALAGLPAGELPIRLARLFPLCAVAHRVVAGAALAAAGAGPDLAPTEAARELALEAALTQVWRATVDWPRCGALPPRPALVKAARAALAAADQADLAEILAEAVFAGSPPQDLSGWLARADTPGARLWQAACGQIAPRPMPPALGARDARWFAARLAGDDRFPVFPEAEDGPADVFEAEGAATDGPLAQRIASQHRQSLRAITDLRAGRGLAFDSFSADPGVGAAMVATTRGPLAALVRVTGDRIADLRLSAPSEWTLHPEGSLVRLIEGTPAELAEARARLAIAACDPCAEVEIITEALCEAGAA